MENSKGKTVVNLVKHNGKYGIRCPETGKYFVNGKWARGNAIFGCTQTRKQCTTIIELRDDWHLESTKQSALRVVRSLLPF